MSGSIYSPTAAQDVVAVFDNAFNQIFINARPVKASIKPSAKLMKHPVESGSTITDFRVIEPVQLELTMILIAQDYVNTYNEIVSVFNGTTTINVQTNVGLYQSLAISSLPHNEDVDHFDTIVLSIKLEEVLIVGATTTSTQSGGNKSGKAASQTETGNANDKAKESGAKGSVLYGLGKQTGAI